MLGRYSLSLVAIGSLASPAHAAEPFVMLSDDTARADVRTTASPAPFQMVAGDITYSGSERADGQTIVRNVDERVIFRDTSSAANATIVLNEGGAASFEDSSTAETANLTVNGAAGFSGRSGAGSAAIVTNATGVTRFSDSANAGSATIENNGRLVFEGSSDAANSAITNNESGTVTFAGASGAGGGRALTNSGTLRFADTATAAQRFIANNETGRIDFGGQSSGGESVIANSGALRFTDRSRLAAGRVVGNAGGTIEFSGEASAETGEIAHAGVLRFAGRSTAGSALIETQTGGTTLFVEEASGAAAEIRLQAGSVLDFSGLTTAGTSVSSVLGNASIFLGGTTLTVGDDGPQRTAGGFADGGAAGGTGGSLIKTGSSVLGLEGVNSYTGRTEIRQGTLLGASERAFAPASAVTVAEGALLDIGGFDQEIGSLAGGGRVDLAANTLRLGGDGRSSVFSGSFGGAGGFEKRGSGTFTLTGASGNFGASVVSGGALVVDGQMPLLPVSVLSGATLSGAGTLGSATVASGGAIAPGFSTLTVAGDAVFATGSIFRIGAQGGADGTAGRLNVGGTARLGGAEVVVELDRAVSFLSEQRFTILAAGLREEEFGGSQLSTDSAFLTSSIEYDGQTATLVVRSNPASPTPPDATPPDAVPPAVAPPTLVTVTETGNQFSTAQALGTLDQTGESLALFNSVLFSNAPNARAAFDQLSGEIHASTQGALLDGSRHAREAVRARIDGALGNVAQGAELAGSESRFATSGLWLDGFGSFGKADGNADAATADRDIGGLFFGFDGAIGDNALLGILGGYSHTEIDVDARNASVDIDSGHLGAYAAGGLGFLELSTGAIYAWNRVDTERSVVFPGFADRLTARYDADTAQVFGEAGARFVLGGLDLKPFAGIAYVHLDADGFTERGGAARLSTASQSSEATFTTLGLRASHQTIVAGREIAVRGMAGWRHASGDTVPTSTSSFVTGLPFMVSGAPISKNAAVLEAGIATRIAPKLSFSVDYVGQFGEDSTDNGFRVGFSSLF